MIRVGVGKGCMVIDRIGEGDKEFIILKNKKEIMELFEGLAKLCWHYSEGGE